MTEDFDVCFRVGETVRDKRRQNNNGSTQVSYLVVGVGLQKRVQHVAVAGGVDGVRDLLEVKRERLPSLIRVVKPVL